VSGPGRRFDPSELRTTGKPGDTQPSDAELAEALGVARELEALTVADGIRPTDGFEDRVMAAIATEPAPRLVVLPPGAVRGGRVGAFLVAIRDAWGVATSGGRPMAVRAQALAFVLLVVVAAGALTTATAVTVGGFLQRSESPSPSVQPAPSTAPTPSTPMATPTTDGSGEPSETPDASETPEATETAEPTETNEAEKTAKPGETPRPARAPRPTETPEAEDTPEPTGTDDHSGSDDGGGGSGHG
jgi:hypothetical protein